MMGKAKRRGCVSMLIFVILFSCFLPGTLFANEELTDPDEEQIEEVGEIDLDTEEEMSLEEVNEEEEQVVRDPMLWPDMSHPAYSVLSPFYKSGVGGQCTGFVWGRAREKLDMTLPFRGNAKTWWDAAEGKFARGPLPAPNSIAVWTNDRYGHVAFVENVEGDLVTINEGNWNTFGSSNGRWGGGYDGKPKTVTRQQMEVRGKEQGHILLGYIYLGQEKPRRLKSDMLGDRREDILMLYNQSGTDTDAWVFMGSQLAFGPAFPLFLSRFDWNWYNLSVVPGDFSGFGEGQFVVFGQSAGEGLRAWLLKGRDLSFGMAKPYALWQSEWNGRRAKFVSGDFTGDERDDVIALHQTDEETTEVWLFSGESIVVGPAEPVLLGLLNWDIADIELVAGDIDGDGISDILALNREEDKLQMILMRGRDLVAQNCRPIPVWQGREGFAEVKAIAGDFTGDFRDDVILFAESEMGIAVWIFKGRELEGGRVTPALMGELDWDWESSQFIAGDFLGDRLWDIVGFRKPADEELDGWLFPGRKLLSGDFTPVKVWQDRWDANRVRYVAAGQSGPTVPGDNSLEAVLATNGVEAIDYLSTAKWFFANTLVIAHEVDREHAVAEAVKRNVPVLLVTSGGIGRGAQEEITRLGVHRVVLIDGAGSVPAGVRQELVSLDLEVERVNVKWR